MFLLSGEVFVVGGIVILFVEIYLLVEEFWCVVVMFVVVCIFYIVILFCDGWVFVVGGFMDGCVEFYDLIMFIWLVVIVFNVVCLFYIVIFFFDGCVFLLGGLFDLDDVLFGIEGGDVILWFNFNEVMSDFFDLVIDILEVGFVMFVGCSGYFVIVFYDLWFVVFGGDFIFDVLIEVFDVMNFSLGFLGLGLSIGNSFGMV